MASDVLRIGAGAARPRRLTAASIRVGLGWVPASGHATRTLAAQEGGPGHPSTGSAGDYVDSFDALRERRDLFLVDERGIGRSVLDCEPLQSLPAPSPRFDAAAAACGWQLNHPLRSAHVGFVHASELFTTADATRDLDPRHRTTVSAARTAFAAMCVERPGSAAVVQRRPTPRLRALRSVAVPLAGSLTTTIRDGSRSGKEISLVS